MDGHSTLTIRLVGNGYIITAAAAPGIDAEQWVARDVKEVCEVLHSVLAKPEGETTA